jgi:hypothetical protein
MATTTPNYGWTVPTSTDLVKDGATAIETLGDSVDATVKALNPETTLGDISYRSSSANTNTRLGIGSTGNILTVAGGVPTWAAPAAAVSGLTLITSSTFTSVSSVSLPDNTFSSTYDNYYLNVNFTSGSASGDSFVRFRTSGTDNSGASYFVTGQKISLTPTQTLIGNSSQTSIASPYIEASSGTETNFSWTIFNPNLSAVTMLLMNSTTRSFTTDIRSAGFNGTTVFDSMTLFPVSGTFSGTYRIYGIQKS